MSENGGSVSGTVVTRKFSTLFWNIEGLDSSTKLRGLHEYFQDADIVQLVGTMSGYSKLKRWSSSEKHKELDGYDSFSSMSVKHPAVGMPKSGIMVYAKKRSEALLESSSTEHVCINTKFGKIFTYYFGPRFNTNEMIVRLVSDLCTLEGGVVVSGDFNCKIDNYEGAMYERGEHLLDTMFFLGFRLRSDPRKKTFIRTRNDKERSSYVDLIFEKGFGFENEPETTAINNKTWHKAILTKWCYFPQQTANCDKLSVTLESEKPSEESIEEVTHLEDIILKCCESSTKELVQKSINETEIGNRENSIQTHTNSTASSTETTRLAKLSCTVTPCYEVKLQRYRQELDVSRGDDVSASFDHSSGADPAEEKAWCDEPITANEILRSLERIEITPNSDINVPNIEQIVSTFHLLQQRWEQAFNGILKTGKVPQNWKECKLNNSKSSIPCALKLFVDILNDRVIRKVSNVISEQQDNLFQGCHMSFETALDAFFDDLEPVFIRDEQSRKRLYAAFVKVTPSAESFENYRICESLSNLGVQGNVYNLLRTLIFDGREKSDSWSSEDLQEKSLPDYLSQSFTWLMPFMLHSLGAFREDSSWIMCGRDLVLYGKDRESVEDQLNSFIDWCKDRNVQIAEAIKGMVFRYKKIMPNYKWNLKLKHKHVAYTQVEKCQIFGFVFTQHLNARPHINLRWTKCAQIIGTVRRQAPLTIEQAIDVYENIFDVFFYGLKYLQHDLTFKLLCSFDNIKARLLKVSLGLPMSLSSTFVFHLVDCSSMGQDVLKFLEAFPPKKRQVYGRVQAIWEKYNRSINQNNTDLIINSGAERSFYASNVWKTLLKQNKEIGMSCTWHGFHEELCTNTDSHVPKDGCICKLCHQEASNQYHILSCEDDNARLWYDVIKGKRMKEVKHTMAQAKAIYENVFLQSYLAPNNSDHNTSSNGNEP